ncbi:hypothetical protein DFQ30_005341, partial [Apophysomyces sp. BC1015]
ASARRAGQIRCRADRRVAGSDRQGRGSPEVQGGDGADRARLGQVRDCAFVGRGAESPGRDCRGDRWCRLPGRDPAIVHAWRLRWRHCVQSRRVRGDLQTWPGLVAHA